VVDDSIESVREAADEPRHPEARRQRWPGDWLPVRGGAWVYTPLDASGADAEVRLLNGPNAAVHADCF
jgi:hypothetical protein